MKVIVRPRARHDVMDHLRFAAKDQDDYRQLERLADEVFGRCRRLGSNPAIQGSLIGASPGVRVLPYRSFLIYLRYEQGRVVVLRILHHSRDRDVVDVSD